MVRFRFRLEASLRLAEQDLETAQRQLAEAIQRWQVCLQKRNEQEERFQAAMEGQREAGRLHPETLGTWQAFVLEQRRRLRRSEQDLAVQEGAMEAARQTVLGTHREVEKFRRLKEKQAKAFWLAELRKEQKTLDEAGQVLYWRQGQSTLA